MSNGEENGNNPKKPSPQTQEELRRRGREEELGRAERQLKADEARLEATKEIAAQEGRVLDALKATIDAQRQAIQFKIEYGDLQEDEIGRERRNLAILEAKTRALEQTAAAGKKLASALKLQDLTDSGLADYVENLGKARQAIEGGAEGRAGLIKKVKELGGVFFTAASAQRIASRTLAAFVEVGVRKSFELGFSADKVTAAFTAQTGIVGSLRDSIDNIAVANFRLGISLEDVSGATKSLVGGFSEFVALSEAQQRTLVENAAQLQKIGLSTDVFASSVNELNKSFGMTPSMADDTIRTLSALGIQLGIGADQINRNFVDSLPRLRVYGDRAVEVFRELQIQAREAGTSVSSLNSMFGEQLDTFQGAATAAGRLNAVLGADLFSTTELLLATESERIDIMRERIAMAGVEFTNLGKFQQRALAAAAGINDVNEAAKIFGATQSEVTTQIGGLTLTQEQLEERIQKGRDVLNKLTFAFYSFAIAVEPVVELFGMLGDLLVNISEYASRGGILGRSIVAGTALFLSYKLAIFSAARAFTALATAAAQAAAATTAANAAATGAGSLGGAALVTGASAAAGVAKLATGLAAGAAGAGALGGGGLAFGLGSSMGLEGGGLGAFTGLGAGAGILGGLALMGSGLGFAPGLALLLASAGVGAGVGNMASAQDGGITTQDGIMQVHSQEAIVPLDAFTNKLDELIDAVRSPTGGGDIVVKVMLNDRELGGAVADIVDRRFAGQLLKR